MSDRIIDPTRQGITPGDMPDDDVGTIEFGDGWYTLERTLNLMDTWLPEMNWGLHQMCRVLRAELERVKDALPNIIICPYGEGIECKSGPWAPCCITRRKVCELLGVPVKGPASVEYYKLDDGTIHVAKPASGREPRISAGCFKMEGGE